jgi:hypothetical protein
LPTDSSGNGTAGAGNNQKLYASVLPASLGLRNIEGEDLCKIEGEGLCKMEGEESDI